MEQWSARRAHNPEVAGSNPAPAPSGGCVAQRIRAFGSYPKGPGFESPHSHLWLLVLLWTACAPPRRPAKPPPEPSTPQIATQEVVKDPFAAYGLENLLRDLDRLREVLQEIAQKPESWEGITPENYGRLYRFIVDWVRKAVAEPNTVEYATRILLSRNPEDPILLVTRAWALQQLGKRKEAGELARRLLKDAPALPLAQLEILIEILLDLEFQKEAESLLRRLIQEQPEWLPAYSTLAQLFIQQDRDNEAETILKRALERFPRFLFGYLLLGDIALKRGDLERARELYFQAGEISRKVPPVLERLCRLEIRLGNRERAEFYYTRYIELPDHDPEVARRLKEEIARLP